VAAWAPLRSATSKAASTLPGMKTNEYNYGNILRPGLAHGCAAGLVPRPYAYSPAGHGPAQHVITRLKEKNRTNQRTLNPLAAHRRPA